MLCFQAAFFLLVLGLGGAGLALVGELLAASHTAHERGNNGPKKGEERCAQVLQTRRRGEKKKMPEVYS